MKLKHFPFKIIDCFHYWIALRYLQKILVCCSESIFSVHVLAVGFMLANLQCSEVWLKLFTQSHAIQCLLSLCLRFQTHIYALSYHFKRASIAYDVITEIILFLFNFTSYYNFFVNKQSRHIWFSSNKNSIVVRNDFIL